MDLVRRLSHDSAPAARGCFTVGVCPVEGGDYAIRMAAELALMAARQSRARILLLETNTSAKAVCDVFGLAADAPGLGEMLAPPPNNRFDTIHPTDVPNLFVMPAGKLRRAVRPEQMEWVHSVLAAHFQGIVMELPPMGEFLARAFCSRIPNAVVLAAHEGCGSWAIRRALRRLRAAKVNLAGASIVKPQAAAASSSPTY